LRRSDWVVDIGDQGSTWRSAQNVAQIFQVALVVGIGSCRNDAGSARCLHRAEITEESISSSGVPNAKIISVDERALEKG
jgi:hypothetical protein